MAVNVPVLVGILVFYSLVFIVGILASRVTRSRKSASQAETLIVGAKDLGIFVAVCTMAATWYGGVEINGTAEVVYTPYQGLTWAIGLPAAGVSSIVNGLFFVKKMRDTGYLTTLDPYEAKYGKYATAFFFLNDATGSIFFVAATLNALGSTLEVVAGLPRVLSVVVSAAVSVIYTVIGGMYSVAYTDVIQLFVTVLGLVLAIPFAMTHEAVSNIAETAFVPGGWMGESPANARGSYADLWTSVVLGGIPLQIVYQRVFAVKTTKNAQIFCVIGGIAAAVLAVPPVLIGAIGASTNWSMTEYMNGSGVTPLEEGGARLILPAVLQYLTPPGVAFFGLGAVSAGVMSSVDSGLLAAGTLVGRNIWKKLIRTKASEREVVIVMRISIVLVATVATVIAFSINSILALFYLCADFSFIAAFPPFFSVLFLDPNIYGILPALLVGAILRIGGGDYLLNWPALYDYVGGTNFPVKTVSMLASLVTLNVTSYLAKFVFAKGWIPEKYDILKGNLAHGGRTRYLKGTKKDLKETTERSLTALPEIRQNDRAEENKEIVS